ncbi:hypothetical protein PV797_12365 [Clostridiaceae bacterium M8S5]|nr:hypothetical protein PV797_12365 [Clostridiaceae bacterium M8S5]
MNDYFSKLEQFLYEDISHEEAIYVNMVIAESYSLLKDKGKWAELSYKTMQSLREGIQSQALVHQLALFGGFCEIGLSTYMTYKNTGIL